MAHPERTAAARRPGTGEEEGRGSLRVTVTAEVGGCERGRTERRSSTLGGEEEG